MIAFMEHWALHIGRPPRLLLVDDQPANILALNQLFRAGCEVFMATDGEQALRQAEQARPDLILLDVMMDHMGGHEVCQRLKACALTEDIPIIFLTSHRSEADEVRGFQLGAVDFISKPVNPVIVRARVETHLKLKLQGDLLRRAALTDSLTGLANRRHFDEQLMLHWRQCQRDQTPLALILVDVDHFKRYNDHYGHPAGDACLRTVALTLGQGMQRPYDLAARYGGEEFACLLPHTSASGAQHVAEQLQQLIEGLALPHEASPLASHITVSQGVAAQVPTTGSGPQQLIEAADAQLYRAKQGGRARFCLQP
ncbi:MULTISPECIES: diguanylate cyclase domain-containing protein [unclassified Pseudomonas]|uniref:diguanylate cyclase domain-containing protein n=1 Tax=unclassified Pseudomonas TaxID=196821 RepID=UPI000BCF257C|nr:MULTISPECIES: diguanylate cyclase [unclassified Pseudomonas]PVZ20501.1 diguanylate cyclase (GGDEF)-like protein [Pseudomonas sp. URIL14HWK12:I12]PVZ27567.1 diguanylate cyclase (GGDEF)-like protein [Pseudomonas sp. URIL14HWK12:I10]PVZ38456.1 diguanylate cyclase (GGDEF)-like protein [Pseudomonas sp. URIL14HWK12:I11]SNZ03282.1 response regulator receiver modulated diguanylate cyclase [Pseudomonas sp. URIL14HWK12:I9]